MENETGCEVGKPVIEFETIPLEELTDTETIDTPLDELF